MNDEIKATLILAAATLASARLHTDAPPKKNGGPYLDKTNHEKADIIFQECLANVNRAFHYFPPGKRDTKPLDWAKAHE